MLFLTINGSVYFFTEKILEKNIKIAVDENLKILQTHYNILYDTQRTTAKVIYSFTIGKQRVLEILSQARGACNEDKKLLRDELQILLTPMYDRAKMKGVLQYHFVFPDNISFLRMHKPNKFGDDLTDIRADFKYVNETKKMLRVFTQGRTSHGFRNTFPIFDKNNKHIGAMEISFSSDSFQWSLNHISKIHTHFLVDKNIFNAKAWLRDDLIIKYTQSVENQHFMLALGNLHTQEKCIDENKIKLAPIKKEIELKMLQESKFSLYAKHAGHIDIVSFIPIKNLDDKAIAWLVSYEKSPSIESTFFMINIVRVITLLFSSLLVYLVIKMVLQSKIKDYEEHILSLVDIIEKRDTYTAGHTKRVALYSVLIAKEMGCTQKRQDEMHKAAMLHDIGKISIPDSILLKPNKLTRLEYEIIQEHVTISYEILSKTEIYKNIANIIRHHHERHDGAGYPQGLKGSEIPVLSQIMIVADAFDAMTTNRIYKSKMSVDEAVNEIKELAGKQFNPKIANIAALVLADVKIENSITQKPTTKIERERFAYFYRDAITGAYNREYLDVILAYANTNEMDITCINGIYLHNFSNYNKKYSWAEGDKLLKKFAIALDAINDSDFVFRVFGDDFVMLNQKHFDMREHMVTLEKVLIDTNITMTLSHFDMKKHKITTIYDLEKLF